MNEKQDIEKLGFDRWFQERSDSSKFADCRIARVVAVHKNSYTIADGKKELFSETTGKLMFGAATPLDLPAVGDWVYAQCFDDESFAVIREILPRKSLLRRKTSGKRVDFQLIAVNIDTAMVMQSLDSDYNLRRLERYLVMVHESNIQPVVLLSKSDLVGSDEMEKKSAAVREIMPAVPIVAFSNAKASDLDRIRELLIPGQTYCMLGSSGVGKTTLLNRLVNEERFATRTVREKDRKGRHATARRQLVVLENGAMVVDTPGMRELGIVLMESGLDETFRDIAELSERCRYRDCTHVHEEECAVLKAQQDGTLSVGHYQNYLKMRKESLYHGMSYFEKRQKDKTFGKFIKSVMKWKWCLFIAFLSGLAAVVAAQLQDNKDKAQNANPIAYVEKHCPPFLIVHGEKDPLVPHHQSELLVAALQKAGVPVRFYTVPGGGHGSFKDPNVEAITKSFFAEHLKPAGKVR